MAFNLSMSVIGSAVRNAALPDFLQPEEMPPLSLNETMDLSAFQEAGWHFTKTRNFNWGSLVPDDPARPVELGMLAKRERGGLVILRFWLVIGLRPGVDSAPILAPYPEKQQLSFGSNLHEVRLPFRDGDLEQLMQDEINKLHGVHGPLVRFSEPVVLYHVEALPTPSTEIDDPNQWHWGQIRLTEAWDHVRANTLGGTGKGFGTKVAVIDNGFFEHPQFAAIISKRISLTEAGRDTGRALPKVAHGTMCAALIGAAADGSLVNGAAPECELILCAVAKTTNSVGFGEAVKRCANEGADVISCSLGPFGGAWDKLEVLIAAIDDVRANGRATAGCVLVWAVSNNDEEITSDVLEFHEPVVCVAPSDKQDNRIPSSAHGARLDLIAPGIDVKVINFYGQNLWSIVGKGGSSFAAPMVAGVAALVLSKNPTLSTDTVTTILTSDSCDPELAHVRTNDVGFGRLNALRAVKATPLPP